MNIIYLRKKINVLPKVVMFFCILVPNETNKTLLLREGLSSHHFICDLILQK